jgi:hypothetical protein
VAPKQQKNYTDCAGDDPAGRLVSRLDHPFDGFGAGNSNHSLKFAQDRALGRFLAEHQAGNGCGNQQNGCEREQRKIGQRGGEALCLVVVPFGVGRLQQAPQGLRVEEHSFPDRAYPRQMDASAR